MTKKVTIDYWACVYQRHITTWTEENYRNLIAKYKQEISECPNPECEDAKDSQKYVEWLSQYSWDDVLKRWQEHEEEGHCKNEQDEDLILFLEELMRSENYESPVVEEDYGDGYDEEWQFDNKD